MNLEAVPCSQPGCVDLYDVRYPDDDVLHLNAADWAEFLVAVKRGSFDDLAKPGTTEQTSEFSATHRGF
jgi:hypothetical protein